MERESPIIQQPTNFANDDYKSQHSQDPQLSNVPESMNAQLVPSIPGVPIGLEPLIQLDHFLVKRHVDTLSGAKVPNSYDVFDGQGQRIFVGLGRDEPGSKCCCCISTVWLIDILDSFGRKILTMRRQHYLVAGDVMSISLGDGTSLGEIHQVSCGAAYDIKNANGERILHTRGPEGCCNFEEIAFVLTEDGEEIGKIWNAKTAFLQGFEDFEAELSGELDVTTKALILAAVFLIDAVYTEAHLAELRKRGVYVV